MKILFYLAHPAHFHLFKNAINKLINKGHSITITIKKKDVLENLLLENKFDFINILKHGRKGTKFGIAKGLITRTVRHYKLLKRNKYDLVLSSSAELGVIAKVLKTPFINVFEDDLSLFPKYSKYLIPFVDVLLVPESCNTVNWGSKTIKYKGNQELAYLHSKYFIPDITIAEKYLDIKKKNFILRFAKLDAWHDAGMTGLTGQIFNKVIELLEPYGNILVTSEVKLNKEHEKYRLNVPASYIHHILYYSDIYIGDSQTMTAEAAVLGTPAIRFNDFVGKIGYLEELESKYELAFGIKTDEPEKLFNVIKKLLSQKDLKNIFLQRRNIMLNETILLSDFLVWFIENYPNSFFIMKNNPDFQNKFKHIQ